MTGSARDFARLPPAQAINWMRQRGLAPPDVYYRLPAEYRALSFSISGVAALDQLQAVLDSLGEALTSGQSFESWRKSAAASELGLPRARLDNIFRTNLQGAYMRGTYERQRQVQSARPYLMYDAINDGRTRPAHRAMDNFIASADDAIWKRWRPPAGFRCRCSLISLTEAQARARGYNGSPPPAVDPDDGWDYDRAEGIAEGVKRSVRSLSDRCALSGAERLARGRRSAPAWCSPGLFKDRVDQLTAWTEREGRMPEPRSPAGLHEVPEGLSDRQLLSLFVSKVGGPEFVDVMGEMLLIDEALFTKQSGASKLEKRGRSRWLEYIADTVRHPQEIWTGAEPRASVRYYLGRYQVRQRLVQTLVVFNRSPGDDPWSGVTAFASPSNPRYLQVKRLELLERKIVPIWIEM